MKQKYVKALRRQNHKTKRQNAKKINKNVVGHQRLKTKESQENSPIILLQLNTHHLTRETGKKKNLARKTVL